MRERWRGWSDTLHQDVRYAVRRLTREPGFTATAILILAVGIGGCTGMFSIVQAVLLRPLGVDAPQRLVIASMRSTQHSAVGELSYRTYRELRARARSLDNMAILGSVNWSGAMSIAGGEPVRMPCSVVSYTFFDVLGTLPRLGRTFRAEDDEPAAPRVLILSHAAWEQHFGGDPTVIGRRVTVREEASAEAFEIVGVMPPEFFFPRGAAYWTPATPRLDRIAHRGRAPVESVFNDLNVFYGLARLATGSTITGAERETTTLLNQIADDAGAVPVSDTRVVLTPILDHIFGNARPALLTLMGAVVVVLLVTCINVAGLSFARGASRMREMAVRAALGAGRAALVRQLMAESAAVAVVATLIGVGAAALALETLVALSPANIPRLDATTLDGRVLGFAIALTVATTLLVGLVPAVRLSRPSVADALKGSVGRRVHKSWRARPQQILMTVQVAATFVLVIAAGLCVNSFARLARLDLGFDSKSVLTFHVNGLGDTRYPLLAQQYDAIEDLLSKIERIPRVVAAGAVFQRPFEHGAIGLDSGFLLEGQVDVPEARVRNPMLNYESVTSGYFSAMGIRLLRGRYFDSRDNESSPRVVIVSEAMAARVWPGEDPIGKRLRTTIAAGNGEGRRRPWQTVVGVVATARYREIEAPRFELYVPLRQAESVVQHFMVRTAVDPLPMAPTVAAAVASFDKALSVGGVTTMNAIVRRARGPWQFTMLVFTLFGGVALALAAVGLFALAAHEVTQRSREIGLRMALGARRASVVRLMIMKGANAAAVGLGIGILTALLMTRVLSGLLFEISPVDPATFGVVLVLLISVALLASYLAARRAASIDPQEALRDA